MTGLVELRVGPAAHGGHCVARHEGRVVFVRHTLPGEVVLARLTEAEAARRFWRADAVEVLSPSPDRVPSAWPAAGPGGVGGGELAHVSLPGQRAWKAAVVAEQLRRLAGVEREVEVEAAPGDDQRGGLGWRTRVELVVDGAGRAGMYRHRTHDVVPLESMPLASPEVAGLGLFDRRWPPGARLTVAAPAGGDRPALLVDGEPWAGDRPDRRANARRSVREKVTYGDVEYRYRVSAAGFWQVHVEAPRVLVEAALGLLGASDLDGDLDGGTVLDLYAGAGLFTQPLADVVGPRGSVLAVEGDARAAGDARRSCHHLPQAELVHGDVRRTVGRLAADGSTVDAVLLDPPRTGAGRQVLEHVAALAPSRVVYVACDPAALARDTAYLDALGYRLESLRAVDIFPMTHHVECVAGFSRTR